MSNNKSKSKWCVLLLLCLWPAIGYCQKTSSIKKITMYYGKIEKYTRTPIDTSSIEAFNDLEVVLKKPEKFIIGFEDYLRSCSAIEINRFGYSYVRIMLSVQYKSNNNKKLSIDASKNILWMGKAYKANSVTLNYILSALGERNIRKLKVKKY